MKAAQQGHAPGQNNVGQVLEKGLGGVAVDQKAALDLYLKAAQQGYTGAQCNAGSCYFFGKGTPQDYNQALAWFRKASAPGGPWAPEGDAQAQYMLGNAYAVGRGVPPDMKQALQWYKKAAQQLEGHANAEYNLAELYSHGDEGIAQDRKQALAYFLKAAQHGEPPMLARAQLCLGECFERGWGTAVDLKAARSWYAKAAAQGSEEARARLMA